MSDMIEKRTPEQIGAEIRMYMDVRQRNPETGEKLKTGAATLLKNLLKRMEIGINEYISRYLGRTC